MLFWGKAEGGPREGCVSLRELRQLLTLKAAVTARRDPETVNQLVKFATELGLILGGGGKLHIDVEGESLEAAWPLLDSVAEWTGIRYDRGQVKTV
jgi:hypothetical protein